MEMGTCDDRGSQIFSSQRFFYHNFKARDAAVESSFHSFQGKEEWSESYRYCDQSSTMLPVEVRSKGVLPPLPPLLTRFAFPSVSPTE